MEAVAPERAELTKALRELDAALDDTRAARVAAMAAEPLAPGHLAGLLGDPPTQPAGRAAWCGIAYRVESYRDRHPEALEHAVAGGVMAAIGSRPGERWCRQPEWDELADHLAHGADLVGMARGLATPGETLDKASSWLDLVSRAGRLVEAETATFEREISRDRGMELGL